jgi:predicted nuclease with TOPRIM domain
MTATLEQRIDDLREDLAQAHSRLERMENTRPHLIMDPREFSQAMWRVRERIKAMEAELAAMEEA